MTARPEPTLGADERELFEKNELEVRFAAKDSLRRYGPDDDEYMLPLTQARWQGWQARAALAAPAVVVSAEPVVFALRWAEDPRLNLSTVFDTELEAKEYAEKCLSSAEIVPLYTQPATPVDPDAVDARDAARYRWLRDHSDPDGEITGLSCSEHDFNDWGNPFTRYFRGPELDAKVDAALASTKPSKGAA